MEVFPHGHGCGGIPQSQGADPITGLPFRAKMLKKTKPIKNSHFRAILPAGVRGKHFWVIVGMKWGDRAGSGRRMSPGHEVWGDIGYIRISRPGTFPTACNGTQWSSLCKDLGIQKTLQDWGCGDPFILKCREKIATDTGQWSQNWGKTQEWGMSSHSWLPLCSASG